MVKKISYSQYTLMKQCKRRYELAYLKKIILYMPNEHTFFGTAIHEAIQSHMKNNNVEIYQEFTNSLLSIIDKYITKTKKTDIISEETFIKLLDDGKRILSEYEKRVDELYSDEYTLIGIETELDYPLSDNIDDIHFFGLIDVVLFNEVTKKYLIIDIKTSTSGWSSDDVKEKRIQLLLYKWYFSLQFNIPLDDIETEYLILKRNKPNISYGQKSDNLIRKVSVPSKRTIKPEIDKFKETVFKFYDKKGKPLNVKFENNISPDCIWCPYAGSKLCR